MASGRMMAAPTCVKMQCVKMQCVKVQCMSGVYSVQVQVECTSEIMSECTSIERAITLYSAQ
jgi:hypothetical protein